jgi:hypothetical protein
MKWCAFWMVNSFGLFKGIWKGDMQYLFDYIDISTGWPEGHSSCAKTAKSTSGFR